MNVVKIGINRYRFGLDHYHAKDDNEAQRLARMKVRFFADFLGNKVRRAHGKKPAA